ncbi:MAG: HAD hydrolase-like protein [Oscillospiraceae bacterium]|nr:HAD hydrolase-like protein [Oscillospiraceae bacterium]
MRYKSILFDFDGTLADSRKGIVNGVKYACGQMGLTEGAPWEDWKSYIGPTVYRYTTEVLGLNEAGRDRFMHLYSVYYESKGIFEAPLYEGIKELLGELRTKGRLLYLASSKPRLLAEKSLEYLGLRLDGAVCAEGELFGKREIIERCLAIHSIERESAVMVGDRDSDILGARSNGLASIAVSYGYGGLEELQESAPCHIAASVAELKEILLA